MVLRGRAIFQAADRPAGFNGPFTSEKDPRYIGKINWAASPNVKVEGFYEWDRPDITGRGADTHHPIETTVIEPSPETNYNVRLTWTINSKTLLDVRNGGYVGYYPLEPTPPNSRTGPYPRFNENGDSGEHVVRSIARTGTGT